MADDITYTSSSPAGPPDTTKQVTDEHASRGHMPVFKLAIATDGSATLIPADSDGLLVNLGSNNDVTVSGVSTAANQSTIIGHVDGIEALLTTIDADTSNLSVVGGGTEAAAIRVTIANNSTGVLSVDDNGSTLSIDDGGSTITVDGTVTAELGATDNAVLDNIDADLTTIIGHVDGLEGLLTTGNTNSGNSATSLAIIDDWDESDRAKVNVIAGQAGIAGGTGTDGATVPRVTLATNVPLPAGTNAIGKLSANSGVDIGDVDVTSIAAGTNTIGDVGVKPRTSGGLSMFRSLDIDETEEDVKTSAGQVFGWYIFNAAASTRYVKFYNATAANVTVGSTTPVLTLPVPAGGAANVFSEIGIAFSTAITVAATTGVADADTGAPSANDVIINVFYS